MSDAQQPGSGSQANKAHIDWLCDWIRQGAESTAEMFTLPPSAGVHFRQARIEFLRGMRELIDRKIERLSQTQSAKS